MTKFVDNAHGENGDDKILKLNALVIVISHENVAQGVALVVGFKRVTDPETGEPVYVVLLHQPPFNTPVFFLHRDDIEWHSPGEWHHHMPEEGDDTLLEIFDIDDIALENGNGSSLFGDEWDDEDDGPLSPYGDITPTSD